MTVAEVIVQIGSIPPVILLVAVLVFLARKSKGKHFPVSKARKYFLEIGVAVVLFFLICICIAEILQPGVLCLG